LTRTASLRVIAHIVGAGAIIVVTAFHAFRASGTFKTVRRFGRVCAFLRYLVIPNVIFVFYAGFDFAFGGVATRQLAFAGLRQLGAQAVLTGKTVVDTSTAAAAASVVTTLAANAPGNGIATLQIVTC
jgi:hypothetical protein